MCEATTFPCESDVTANTQAPKPNPSPGKVVIVAPYCVSRDLGGLIALSVPKVYLRNTR